MFCSGFLHICQRNKNRRFIDNSFVGSLSSRYLPSKLFIWTIPSIFELYNYYPSGGGRRGVAGGATGAQRRRRRHTNSGRLTRSFVHHLQNCTGSKYSVWESLTSKIGPAEADKGLFFLLLVIAYGIVVVPLPSGSLIRFAL